MSKPAPKKKALTVAEKILRQQRALEAGKAGYKQSDALVDELVADAQEGKLKIGEPVPLGNGQMGRVVDRFAEKNKVGYGGAVRRYEVEISRADDVTAKL